MAPLSLQSRSRRVWKLAARQHGVVALFQLLALGYTLEAIKWRVAKGRLHPIYRGVYALGRPDLTRKGEWMAAILACAPTAVLSHDSAAARWGIRLERDKAVHVSVAASADRRRRGIVVHRRSALRVADITRRDHIPVTTPIRTLIDLATQILRHSFLRASSKGPSTKPTSSTWSTLPACDGRSTSAEASRAWGSSGPFSNAARSSSRRANSSGAFSRSRPEPGCHLRSPSSG